MAKKSKPEVDIRRGKTRVRATGWAAIIIALGIAMAFIIIALLYFK